MDSLQYSDSGNLIWDRNFPVEYLYFPISRRVQKSDVQYLICVCYGEGFPEGGFLERFVAVVVQVA